MAGVRPPGPPTPSLHTPHFPTGPPAPLRPPVNGQGPPSLGPGAYRPVGPPVRPPGGPPTPVTGPPRPVLGPPVTPGPPQLRPPGGLNGGPPVRPGGPPGPFPSPGPPASNNAPLPPSSSQGFAPPGPQGFKPPTPQGFAPPGAPPSSQGFAPPPSSQGFAVPPSSQSQSFAPPAPQGFAPPHPSSSQGFAPRSGPPTPQGFAPPPSSQGFAPPSRGPTPTSQGPGGQAYSGFPGSGPPPLSGPPGGPPPPSQGPPSFTQRYPGAPLPPMGPPLGPLVMGAGSNGPPPMSNGPPPMGNGPPPMGNGPPPMGNGLPPMGNGPPPMGNGPPLMSNGPPPMGNGPPPMGNGPPPMASSLPPHMGPPPLSNGPPGPVGMPPLPPVQGGRFGGDVGASLANQLGGLSVTQNGFQKMWGQESVDLLQNRHILPTEEVTPPKPRLQAEQWNNANCSGGIFRSTLTRIPETDALLKKARLPLGVLIHPFRDLSHLPVIQCTTIVRCRSCRTYINPFVHFVDQRRWRCNLCYRVNELPEEFLYDPVSKSYGDPSRRPECKSSTIEFIAPQEYMLRPPQPAVYLFLLDVSRAALETGYLRTFCDSLIDELDKLPGDGRTQVGFITYHRSLQFYQLPEGATQATQLVVGDVDDVFLPSPSDLLANLSNCREQVINMLSDLPELFNGSQETENCLGAALQAAYKMVHPTGGRITVVQGSLPNIGPGSVTNREAGAGEKAEMTSLLNPSTDFYKKLALDCSGQQIAVDLFVIANQHCDLATLSGISKFSGGQVQTFPGYHSHHNPPQAERFERAVRRYLTRKIGFEAVMRIRCTRGMSLHTFHGHFFVRSTDLLSLPNVNPDTAFGMQVSIEEDLKDSREVSFQAALLYTSSKGERRIRVHTLCLPTTASLQEVVQGADQHCIVGLLSKMAVDRTLNSSLADAREAFINVCVDAIERWKLVQCITQPGVLPSSAALKLVPLLVLAALKSPAFTSRPGLKLDERTAALIQMKCLPLAPAIQSLYPDMYRVDALETVPTREDEEGVLVPDPPRLQLSAEKIALNGAYLLDSGDRFILFLGKVVSSFFCERIFGVSQPSYVDENLTDLPELENEESERLRSFIASLNNGKSHSLPVRIIRDDSKSRAVFTSLLADDRSENTFSYYEFLQHLKTQVK